VKIAVSAMADNMDAQVDPRFGRCAYFVIAEIEGNEVKGHKVIKNTGVQASRGAGITAGQIIANEGVEAVITGNVGPNAFNVLSQTGIKIYTGVVGVTVKSAIEKYLKGELKETDAATGPVFGGGRDMGPGMGTGRGRGIGGGAGRGAGGGFDRGPGMGPGRPDIDPQ
jgi:predicted Fe-Mo cluster-binding NifX family protein